MPGLHNFSHSGSVLHYLQMAMSLFIYISSSNCLRDDATYTREIKSRVSVTKAAFNKKKNMLSAIRIIGLISAETGNSY